MIISPIVKEYYIYIDDGGFEKINILGFTYLLIDSFTRNCIKEKIKLIKEKYKISRIHGNIISSKNYKIYIEIYKELFIEVIFELKRANIANLICRFGTTEELNNNYKFVYKSIIGILEKNETILTRNISIVSEIASYVIFPLMTLNKLKDLKINDDVKLFIVMDKKKKFDKYMKKIISFHGNILTGFSSIKEILLIIINTWFKVVMKNIHNFGQFFKIHSIDIIPSHLDPLLEVVDAFSYFVFQFFISNIPNYPITKNQLYKSLFFNEIIKGCNEDINIDIMKTFITNNFIFQNGKIVSKTGKNIYVFELLQKENI